MVETRSGRVITDCVIAQVEQQLESLRVVLRVALSSCMGAPVDCGVAGTSAIEAAVVVSEDDILK